MRFARGAIGFYGARLLPSHDERRAAASVRGSCWQALADEHHSLVI